MNMAMKCPYEFVKLLLQNIIFKMQLTDPFFKKLVSQNL